MNIEDEKQLNKILTTIRIASVIVLMLHFYWFAYGFFRDIGFVHTKVNEILMRFQTNNGLFSHQLFTKGICVLLLAISCLGTKGKKDEKIGWAMVRWRLFAGCALFFLTWWLLDIPKLSPIIVGALYIVVVSVGYLLLLQAGTLVSRILQTNLMHDRFNEENESFMQETRYLLNPNKKIPTIHLKTKFYYAGREHSGWINVVNPHRATNVLGTPGSGKSFAVINQYIKQLVEQGNAMYLYDYKFPTLTDIAFNHYRLHPEGYAVKPKIYIVNFDDPRKSHRCNPLNPKFLTDIADAYESSYVIMLNLNRTWVKKQGDFFVESPIVLFAAIIWFLKLYDAEHGSGKGRYCTFPHAIELLNQKYEDFFPILMARPELGAYIKNFVNSMEGGAMEQLQGQIASAQIPISRMVSPRVYWVLSGNDFSLDINNPAEPKILCIGNNPERENIYATSLGLLNARIVQLVNKPDRLPSAIVVDEMPTMYFRKIDNLIATARSNKVAVLLGFQDYSQLKRDYGEEEYKVIVGTVGNYFAGQVFDDTAKSLQERFGKVLQKRQSTSINRQDTSTSISTQMDYLIPQGKISSLPQGMFVGDVASDFTVVDAKGREVKIPQTKFHCHIVVDTEAVKAEEKKYIKLPKLTTFAAPEADESPEAFAEREERVMNEVIDKNFWQIKQDVKDIVTFELKRIGEDENLKHLLEMGQGGN